MGLTKQTLALDALNPFRTLSFLRYKILYVHFSSGSALDLLRQIARDAIAPFYTAGRGGLEYCQMNTYNLPAPSTAVPWASDWTLVVNVPSWFLEVWTVKW